MSEEQKNSKANWSGLTLEELRTRETQLIAETKERKRIERNERLTKLFNDPGKKDLSKLSEAELNQWERDFFRKLY